MVSINCLPPIEDLISIHLQNKKEKSKEESVGSADEEED